MEEVTLKDVLNVVLDVKQELKQEMNQMKQEMNEMKQDIVEMKQDIKKIKLEQADTRTIVGIIVEKIGEIDRKLDAQAKDKCIFHKTLVGAKCN